MRTALTTSGAPQSLETKPDAPAAGRRAGEIDPAPEISSTFVGATRGSPSQISAPDSPPRKRSTSATCGCSLRGRAQRLGPFGRRGSARPTAGARAAGENPSARRRGRPPREPGAASRRRPRRGTTISTCQRSAGRAARTRRARVLERLERRQPQPQTRRGYRGTGSIVRHVEHDVVVGAHRDVDPGRARVLVGVAYASSNTACAVASAATGISAPSSQSTTRSSRIVEMRSSTWRTVIEVVRAWGRRGRPSAPRSSPSTSRSSSWQTRRWSESRSSSDPRTSTRPKSRWIRPRGSRDEVDALREPARGLALDRCLLDVAARAASLPSDHIACCSESVSSNCPPPRSAKRRRASGLPAETGVQVIVVIPANRA